MTPVQAGWSVVDCDAVELCPGSGQLAAFVAGLVACPVCGRTVAAILPTLSPPSAPYLVDHRPPAVVAPTMSLGL